jgi:catechol 2,3-dioxygenase-like lactoylglutathione lyase family enzyme
MSMPRSAKVVSFIVTRDRDLAKAFYGAVLGFPVTHEDDFAVVFDLGGVALRISTVENHQPQPHTVLGWSVEDIGAVVRDLRAKGVAFAVFEGFGQDELGIWRPPGGATQVAWFRDPDGNLLSLAEGD